MSEALKLNKNKDNGSKIVSGVRSVISKLDNLKLLDEVKYNGANNFEKKLKSSIKYELNTLKSFSKLNKSVNFLHDAPDYDFEILKEELLSKLKEVLSSLLDKMKMFKNTMSIPEIKDLFRTIENIKSSNQYIDFSDIDSMLISYIEESFSLNEFNDKFANDLNFYDKYLALANVLKNFPQNRFYFNRLNKIVNKNLIRFLENSLNSLTIKLSSEKLTRNDLNRSNEIRKFSNIMALYSKYKLKYPSYMNEIIEEFNLLQVDLNIKIVRDKFKNRYNDNNLDSAFLEIDHIKKHIIFLKKNKFNVKHLETKFIKLKDELYQKRISNFDFEKFLQDENYSYFDLKKDVSKIYKSFENITNKTKYILNQKSKFKELVEKLFMKELLEELDFILNNLLKNTSYNQNSEDFLSDESEIEYLTFWLNNLDIPLSKVISAKIKILEDIKKEEFSA